jgi:hypothetical protein
MNKNSNNVVSFPKTKIPSNMPTTIEEIEDNMEMIRQIHIQETIETVMPILFDQISIAGFPPENETDDMKEGALIVEAVRSLLCKVYGVSHPFQDIAENIFIEDGGELKMAGNIKIIISDTPFEENKE